VGKGVLLAGSKLSDRVPNKVGTGPERVSTDSDRLESNYHDP
jgi:hypothetical protein